MTPSTLQIASPWRTRMISVASTEGRPVVRTPAGALDWNESGSPRLTGSLIAGDAPGGEASNVGSRELTDEALELAEGAHLDHLIAVDRVLVDDRVPEPQ